MRSITASFALLLAATLLVPTTVEAGSGCGGCPKAASCAGATRAAGNGPAAAATDGHVAPVLEWAKVVTPVATILKVRIPPPRRERFTSALEEKFHAGIEARDIRLMELSSQLWIRTSAEVAEEIERWLSIRKFGMQGNQPDAQTPLRPQPIEPEPQDSPAACVPDSL